MLPCVADISPRQGNTQLPHPSRRPPSVLTQLAWFVGVGVASTLLQNGIYLGLRPFWAPAVASLVSLVISTVVNTELHRKRTFSGSRTAVWRAHLEAGIAAAAVYGLSMSLLAVIDSSWTHLNPIGEAVLITAVTASLGLIRFVILRQWVFRLSRGAR